MGVKLVSASAGSVEIVAPTTASNYTATLPATTGTVMVQTATGSSIASGTKYQVNGTTVSALAWVNFNGTLTTPITPRANYNISSVTKNATGDYTCTFTSAVTDANYAVTGNISALYGSRSAIGITLFTTPSPYTEVAPTTTAFRFFATDSSGTAQDFKYVCVSVFGN